MKTYHYIIVIVISVISLQVKAQTLDSQQQSIAIISALASKGDLINLETALASGMDNGLSPEQVQGIFKTVASHTSSGSQAGAQEVLKALLTNKNSSTTTTAPNKANTSEMIFRISEIEVYPEYLEQYIEILNYEAEASVKLEPGVITILPMHQKNNPNEFRILEIYLDNDAYKEHLLTPHFKYYKESTLKMVKSLKLVDMDILSHESISLIFNKYK